ncbi:MAG: heavy metal translocating P-type ATPase [Halobacteriaceae archaeon]
MTDERGGPSEAPATGASDDERVFLSVEGMHCSTCESFLESRVGERKGVHAAEASYPSDMLRVAYDPGRVDLDDLRETVDGLGYGVADAVSEPGDADTTPRLLVGGFFGMMAMLWYVLFLYPAYLGVPSETLLLDVHGAAGTYLLANLWVTASVVLGYTGFPLLRGAYVSLRAGEPNMDLLVALAASTAYAYSTLVLLTGGTEVYFDVSIVVVLAVTLGNHYESRIKRRATASLTDLTEERVDEARRRTDAGTETVSVSALEPGDALVVKPGERVPVDGEVLEGRAAVDESLLTGESRPVEKSPGDEVIGGAAVADGALVVEVGPEARSTTDRLLTRLWDIQSSRAGVQRLADRLATVFVPTVVALAVLAVGYHLLTGATPTGALLAGLAVLVVSCPCALGLATPLAVSAGVRAALEEGVVVTDAATFERAPEADVVAFDKTGTLTTGEMRVLDVVADGADPAEVRRRAAAVEQFSDHPVAAAVAGDRRVDAAVEAFERHPGVGVAATVEGRRVVVGARGLFADRGWSVPDPLADRAAAAREAGRVASFVGWDGAARGVVVTGDTPRPEWESVVSDLASECERVVVVTGDDGGAADRFRDHPAVDRVYDGVLPAEKVEAVEDLREDGTVVMVGDGSNDAPALAAADLGVALESGTRLAADAAEVVVTDDDLSTVPRVFELVGAARRRTRQNLAWAFLYNAVAVPLAVLGAVNPLFAAVAMASSSLLVVANSARPLRGAEADAAAPDPTPADERPEVTAA